MPQVPWSLVTATGRLRGRGLFSHAAWFLPWVGIWASKFVCQITSKISIDLILNIPGLCGKTDTKSFSAGANKFI